MDIKSYIKIALIVLTLLLVNLTEKKIWQLSRKFKLEIKVFFEIIKKVP